MKKLLIGLTILFSFLFISNVSAYNSTVINSTSDNWIYLNTYGMTKEEIQNYTNKYISYDSSKTSNIPDMILKCREYYETYYSEKYQYYIITSYLGKFTPEYYLLAFNEYPIYMVNYDKNYIYNNTYNYNGLKIMISENKSLDFVYFSTTNGTSFIDKKGLYMMYSGVVGTTDINKKTIYYETNYSMDIYLNYSSNGSDVYSNFYYDDKIFNPGDIVFNTMVDNDINNIKPQGPKIYQYEDQIDTSNIDFIRVKFDVNDIIGTNSIIQFDYSIENSNLNKLPYPYIETLYDYYLTADENDTSTILYKTYELNGYSNSIFEDVLHDINATVYYNFVLDVNGIEDILTLNFSSIYNYEVEIYKSDGTSDVLYQTGSSSLSKNDYLPDYNMVTVDLSGYSGIVLMPKVFSTTDNLGLIYNAIKYDQDYRIYLNGVYDIYIRSTPGNYVTLTDTFKSYSNPYFSKRFKYVSFVDNKNTNLIRIVKSSFLNNNNFITFDSNMYSYSLISSSDEVVILPDANLPDNTINSGTIDEDVSLDEANNTFEDSELSITKFINDIDETLNYVHNVFNIFFNKLPILIQSLLIFVFNIVCIFMLLRMGGWLG